MDDTAVRLPHPGPGAPACAGTRDDGELVRVLATMPAAFCLFDTRWRFRYVNPAAERLIGRSRDELVGRPLFNALPGVVRGRVLAACRSALASGEPVSVGAAAPGEPDRWLEVRAWRAPAGLAVHALDITDRRSAEHAARCTAARRALLAQVGAELSGAHDPVSALGRLAQLVVPTLGDGCIVTVVDREGHVRDVGSWHADPGRRALMQRYAAVRLDTLPNSSPVARALDAGTAITESVEAVLGVMPPGSARDLLVELAPATAVVLPLAAEARTVGVLTLYLDAGRDLAEEELETARQAAVHAGQAVARVHRQSQQALLAEVLQRSLLTDPPETEGATVVVRYVPAAEAARVGGDWYDTFLQADENLMLVIGDVVGHDTAAAAAMGQLRGLLRGIAHYSGAGPAEVLHGLDSAIAGMATDTLATAAVARLERRAEQPDGRWCRLRWANAGHPPPLLLAPDGRARVLGGTVGDLMLGLDSTAERMESVLDVAPGSTLLLYTDGLVERRGSTLDEGLRRLVEHLRDLSDRPAGELCDALLERMVLATPEDDVALVVLRLSP